MNCQTCNLILIKRQKKFCSLKCFMDSPSWTKSQKKIGDANPKKGKGGNAKIWNRTSYLRAREKILARNKQWRQKNKEKFKIGAKKWIEKNKEKNKLIKKAWRERNKATVQSWDAARRALKRAAKVASADKEAIKKFYILAETLTIQTGIKYTVDHIKPLIKGGLHHENNLQVITLSENSRKRDIYPYEVKEAHFPDSMYFNPSPDYITHV